MPTACHAAWDDVPPSPSSSNSSLDEEEVNRRVTPYWPQFRLLLETRGFRLDTIRDVKEFYNYRLGCPPNDLLSTSIPAYLRGPASVDEDALCPDAGLVRDFSTYLVLPWTLSNEWHQKPDNLFRGLRTRDAKRVMVKAVHLHSRECEVIRLLSTPPLRHDRMNHTIPVLDLIECLDHDIAFIVMEEWSSQLIADTPCCLGLFFAALRQCIEHAVFLHKHRIAHLDISLRNLVTDYEGHYAYIDYELSRRFTSTTDSLVYLYRGTEVPPECEQGKAADAFGIDVWALGVLILRACKLTGYFVPELMHVVKPMLHEAPEDRPAMRAVLNAFDLMVSSIGERRLRSNCPTSHYTS